jgi:hypothetical protein
MKHKEWVQNNKERVEKKHQEWVENNRDKRKIHQKRYRDKKKALMNVDELP